MYCSVQNKPVFVDYFTLDVVPVYEITVRLSQPAPLDGYVQVNVFDDKCELGQLSWRTKFSAAVIATSPFPVPSNGLRLQAFSDGFHNNHQRRHKTDFNPDGSGGYKFIDGFSNDVKNVMKPGDLVFLGDEGANTDYRITDPIEYAKLYEKFYELVKKNGGRVSISGEASGQVEDDSWLNKVLKYLKNRSSSTQWVDEWRFHKLSFVAFEQSINRAASWAVDNGAPMVLGSWVVDTESELTQAMEIVQNDNRIVEATFWNYTEKLVDGHFNLNEFGRKYKEESLHNQVLYIE
jgi:hypothetical protein